MITVYFGTNRNYVPGNKIKKFGTFFSSAGGADLRYGHAEVDETDKFAIKSVHVADEDMHTDLDSKKKRKLGSQKVMDIMRKLMTDKKRGTIVYIHGFNYTFTEAVQRAAEYVHALGNKHSIFLVTWPSKGGILLYPDDYDNARRSGIAIARMLDTVVGYVRDLSKEQQCSQDMFLVAHSLGNFALRNALQSRHVVGRKVAFPVFKATLLFAADDDSDALEDDAKLKPLKEITERIEVYYTQRDIGLDVSDLIKGNPERLGSEGPDNMYCTPGKVTAVNVTPTLPEVDDFTNHQYYRLSPVVIADSLRVLEGLTGDDLIGRRPLNDVRKFELHKDA